MEIHRIDQNLKSKVIELINEKWGSGIMVVKGRIHNMENLPGFVAIHDHEIKGLVTYHVDNDECEIVSLDSLEENQGVGTKLIEMVIEIAKIKGCKRVWVITTNDNIRAIRFYQRRGFDIAAIYRNAVQKAREIKPEIPLIGYDDIPILHEIEFEKLL